MENLHSNLEHYPSNTYLNAVHSLCPYPMLSFASNEVEVGDTRDASVGVAMERMIERVEK